MLRTVDNGQAVPNSQPYVQCSDVPSGLNNNGFGVVPNCWLDTPLDDQRLGTVT
jgi:hypothetical protein